MPGEWADESFMEVLHPISKRKQGKNHGHDHWGGNGDGFDHNAFLHGIERLGKRKQVTPDNAGACT